MIQLKLAALCTSPISVANPEGFHGSPSFEGMPSKILTYYVHGSRYVDLLMRKKLWVYPNLDFNPLPTRFNFTEFLPTSMHSEEILNDALNWEGPTPKDPNI